MKRKLLITSTFLLSVILTACSSSAKTDIEIINNQNTIVEDVTTESVFEETTVDETGENLVQYHTYEKSAEWDNIENPQLGIQIDDTFYDVGLTVKDFINQLNSSDNEYTFNSLANEEENYILYSEDATIEPQTSNSFMIEKDNVPWFFVHFANMTDEIIPIDDCICYSISPSEEALPYTWIYGINYEELSSIKFTEIEDKLANIDLLKESTISKLSPKNWDINTTVTKEINGQSFQFSSCTSIEIDGNSGYIGLYTVKNEVPQEIITGTTAQNSATNYNDIIEQLAVCFNNNDYYKMTDLAKAYDQYKDIIEPYIIKQVLEDNCTKYYYHLPSSIGTIVYSYEHHLEIGHDILIGICHNDQSAGDAATAESYRSALLTAEDTASMLKKAGYEGEYVPVRAEYGVNALISGDEYIRYTCDTYKSGYERTEVSVDGKLYDSLSNYDAGFSIQNSFYLYGF